MINITNSEAEVIIDSLKKSRKPLSGIAEDLLHNLELKVNGWQEMSKARDLCGIVMKLKTADINPDFGVFVAVPGLPLQICVVKQSDGRPEFHNPEDFQGWKRYDDQDYE
jgi:hypothetical protein